MRLKEEIWQLLVQGREADLARRVGEERRAVRPLLARLWDVDETIRRRAGRALGQAAAAHPDLGREVIRRAMWALNDESATNGVYAVPALAEIGRQAPDLLAPFVPALAEACSDAGLRLELLRVLKVMAGVRPEAVAPVMETVEAFLADAPVEERRVWRELRAAFGEQAESEH